MNATNRRLEIFDILSREKEVGILPGKGEGLYMIAFSQSNQHTCVELGNATPQGVEAG